MTMHDICSIVLDGTGISLADVLSDSQKGEVCQQRHLCIYFVRMYVKGSYGKKQGLQISWVEIANMFNRHHTSCISSVDQVEAYMTYKDYYARMEFLKNKIELLKSVS